MRFVPLLLAALAFAITFSLMSSAGLGFIEGIDPGNSGEEQLESQAEELSGDEQDIETELEPQEETSTGLLGDTVAAVRGALSIGSMVIRMPNTLAMLGLPGWAAGTFGNAFRILLGLWIYQSIRGTELL